MHPNQKIKSNDWYMKRDPPMCTAADFECMNVPFHDNDNDHVTDKLFANKPVAIDYNIVKNLDYENLNLEIDGGIKYFGEYCVEWFINELLEKEGYKKNYFENEFEENLDKIPKKYDQTTCWLCEKEIKFKDVKENLIVKDHCAPTGNFRGLAHNNCNLKTRKAHTSFVPILFCNFSGYDCHLIFDKYVKMATAKKLI